MLKRKRETIKREFKEFYQRSMPLLTLQYWWEGEYNNLAQITEHSMRFNPLFIYEKDRGTSVYYDIAEPEGDNDSLISYFLTRPKRFNKLADEYERHCRELIRLARNPNIGNFSGVFNSHIANWPMLTAIIILGELNKKDSKNPVAKRAYNLRRQTDKVEYESCNNLIKLAGQLVPDFKEYVDVLTFEEIEKKRIPPEKELKKRKEGYIYFESELFTDFPVKQFEKSKNIKIIGSNNKLEKPRILNGSVAMKGKVIGTARVVLEGKQITKVKDGDVLIASMTTPDYIAAMEKAKAFVTDEGGITCHAAIVSREMKKPCIVGTKIATKVLKDGDRIEVDAEKGIVKILERAK